MTAAINAERSRNAAPPRNVTARTAAISTTDEMTRSWRLLISRAGPVCRSRGDALRDALRHDAAEAPFAGGILAERLGEMLSGEVGPVAGQEDELAVGRLPGQEVGHALLAAGADD